MATGQVTGAEALLRGLRAMGVEHIFASPGSDWSALWEAPARPYGPDEIPSYTSSRHEITAVAMATGYAKATGKLPAVILHTTVGALNGSMAFRAALHERIPMVILAGESISFGDPPSVYAGRQWLRLLADVGGPARLVEGTVKWSFAVNAPSILSASIARACQLAMDAPRGPVFLSFNNAGYLSQKGDVVHEYPEGHAVRTRQFAGTSITPRPDYSLLAQAYGGYGERVASPQAVRGALQRGLEATAGGRLALIDIVLDPVNPTV